MEYLLVPSLLSAGVFLYIRLFLPSISIPCPAKKEDASVKITQVLIKLRKNYIPLVCIYIIVVINIELQLTQNISYCLSVIYRIIQVRGLVILVYSDNQSFGSQIFLIIHHRSLKTTIYTYSISNPYKPSVTY